jgi:hypothetical protein
VRPEIETQQAGSKIQSPPLFFVCSAQQVHWNWSTVPAKLLNHQPRAELPGCNRSPVAIILL